MCQYWRGDNAGTTYQQGGGAGSVTQKLKVHPTSFVLEVASDFPPKSRTRLFSKKLKILKGFIQELKMGFFPGLLIVEPNMEKIEHSLHLKSDQKKNSKQICPIRPCFCSHSKAKKFFKKHSKKLKK